jgi:hypothetical protein
MRACPALISLLDEQRPIQHHWWLADAGFPQRIAGLLAAPLRDSARAPSRFSELVQVFAPLPPLGAGGACPAAAQAQYRYLIRQCPTGPELCCWRRDADGRGWLRRCGPMPLERFVRRFSAPPRASS